MRRLIARIGRLDNRSQAAARLSVLTIFMLLSNVRDGIDRPHLVSLKTQITFVGYVHHFCAHCKGLKIRYFYKCEMHKENFISGIRPDESKALFRDKPDYRSRRPASFRASLSGMFSLFFLS